ncbi:MAG: hypothetical protein JXB10_10930 [Pirellulales bacterium]|nr:hypothetical protein [Pirellulales bacterium]
MRTKILLLAAVIFATAVSGFADSPWNRILSRRVPLTDRTVPYYVGNPRQPAPARQAYPYGFFGAQYRPYYVYHKGYYNNFAQWSYRTGF